MDDGEARRVDIAPLQQLGGGAIHDTLASLTCVRIL